MSGNREVIFVDPSVAGWELIVDRAGEAVRVVVLDSTQDGLAQVAAALAGERGLAAIHIVSHGSAGQVSLGNTVITGDTLAQYHAVLDQIGASLAEGGDILLYGCDVAAGVAGSLFVQQLARATGADVAASSDLTGAAALGGDWELEAHVGVVAATALAAKGYAGTLAVVAGSEYGEWLQGTSDADTLNGGGGDDDLSGGAGDDILDGGADGGYGDTVHYGDGPGGVTVNLQTGIAIDNWGNTDTLTGIEHVTGSDYADTLIGSSGRNWFRPGNGNDVIHGNGGDDVLMYEGGSAPITVNLRNGTAMGADIGIDSFTGIRNLHTSYGADDIQLGDNGGYVFARAGDDIITGGAGSDRIHAGSGNDRIDGGAGTDHIDYVDDYNNGVGNDPTGLGVTVNLVTGVATDNWGYTDTLSNIEDVTGSRYADVITGNTADNQLQGREGDDTLSGGDGNDNLRGGAGNDILQGGSGEDRINAGSGTDRIDGGAGEDDHVSYWDDGSRSAVPTGLGVTVNLLTGTATDLWGHADTLTGIESVQGSSLGDTLTGNAVRNSLWGQGGDDTLVGGDGNDWIDGGDGSDKLQGDAGRDDLMGGAGADIIAGGDDVDAVHYFGEYSDSGAVPSGAGVTVDLTAGTATDNWGNADTLSGIEDVHGSSKGDTITGNAADNRLYGDGGDDTLAGNAGDDYLDGQLGNDRLDAGAGRDTLVGGAGNDTLAGGEGVDRVDYWNDYSGMATPTGFGVTVNLVTGVATDNWGNTDTLSGIEDVGGSRYGDTITGNAADNNLNGQEGNDTIVGGDGRDYLDGGAGRDVLRGGDGDDNFAGGSGADTIDGGAGNDHVGYWNEFDPTVPSSGTGVTVNLATGIAIDNWGHVDRLSGIENLAGSRLNDQLTGNSENNSLGGQGGDDSIEAGDGDDWLDGGDGADILRGEAGRDRLSGGAGNDAIIGGDGEDDEATYWNDYSQVTPSGTGVTVNLATGSATDNWGDTDRLSGIEHVQGSRLGDTITGNALRNHLYGDAGADILVGGDGDDWLTGGSGNDKLQGDAGNDGMAGGAGNDTLSGGEGRDRVDYWSDYDNTATPTGLGVTVNLATGTATDNWGNRDTLAGIEDASGSRYGDTLTGTGADNNLSGHEGNDTIVAGEGYDWLDGGDGNDNLQGGDGNDGLVGGAGADTINGGEGRDRIHYWNEYSDIPVVGGVKVNLTTNLVVDNWGQLDRLVSIEDVSGSRFADSITGSAGDNNLYGDDGNDALIGGDGNDSLDGGNGNDNLQGGNGNDRLTGGAGADTMDGGEGRDTASYFSGVIIGAPASGTGVTVNLASGSAIDSWGNTDKLAGIENVNGSSYDDTITGNADNNSLFGDNGNDTLIGGDGSDSLSGGNGDDTLHGAAGRDWFNGGAGNDTINGGTITDLINYTDSNTVSYTSSAEGVAINLAAAKGFDGFGGLDTLININNVTGSGFDDALTGSSRAVLEIFEGGSGDDVINGGAVTDRVNDTNGNRVLYWNADNAVTVDLALGTATGAAGDDILANITQVFGSMFNDVLRGSDTDLVEQFYGAEGDDLIDGRGGNDQVRYAEAMSAVTVDLRTGIASDGDGGTDRLVDIEGVRGSMFDDTLVGGNTDNGDAPDEGLEFFSGERGDDLIDGGVGFDRADYVTSVAAVSVVLGGKDEGSASDGFGGTDVLRNIEGVRGSNFDDTLTGSDSGAFESFDGRRGNDTINGMGGIDLVDYSNAGAGVNVNLTTGVATDGQGGSDKLSNIEWVRGSLFNSDSLTGNALDNQLEGQGGNDSLNGAVGADTMIGGDGNDTYYVDNVGDVVLETNAKSTGGIDLVVTTISYALSANVENLRLAAGTAINGTGNALNNVIYAGAGRNAIDGGAGIDTLSFEHAAATTTSGSTGVNLVLGAGGALTTASGLSGADTVTNIENLVGSKYNDNLAGNSSANTVNGGAGNDILNGGNGNDVLTGGAGADLFTFSSALSATANLDTITDFAAEDTIRLENAVFTKLATVGTLAAANFKVLGSSALDANDFILYDKDTGYLYYDADGSGAGAATAFALVGVNLTLTNADFTVI